MNNTQKKAKVRKKSTSGENSFLAAFVFGLIVTVAVWFVLSAIVPLVLSAVDDPGAYVSFVSPAVLVLSLVFGGIATGKISKSQGLSAALLVGTAFLGLSYLLSSLFKLTNGMSAYLKTAYILLYIICPLFGAKLAKNNKKSFRRSKRKGKM